MCLYFFRAVLKMITCFAKFIGSCTSIHADPFFSVSKSFNICCFRIKSLDIYLQPYCNVDGPHKPISAQSVLSDKP